MGETCTFHVGGPALIAGKSDLQPHRNKIHKKKFKTGDGAVSTADRVLASHVAKVDLIPDIPYGHLITARINSCMYTPYGIPGIELGAGHLPGDCPLCCIIAAVPLHLFLYWYWYWCLLGCQQYFNILRGYNLRGYVPLALLLLPPSSNRGAGCHR